MNSSEPEGLPLPIIKLGQDRRIASRGMVVSADRLNLYRQAASLLNDEAGEPVFAVEMHPEQTSFDGRPLPEKLQRFVVVGDWLARPYSELGRWWAKVYELQERGKNDD